MTERMKEFAMENQGIIRVCQNAWEEDCFVVNNISDLRNVEEIPGISLFKEGTYWFVEDTASCEIMSVYKAEDFFNEKSATLKMLKEEMDE